MATATTSPEPADHDQEAAQLEVAKSAAAEEKLTEAEEKVAAAAKREVAEAENKVAAAEREVAEAANEVAEAWNKIAVAEREVAEARRDAQAAPDDETCKELLRLALEDLQSAMEDLKWAEEDHKSATNSLSVARAHRNELMLELPLKRRKVVREEASKLDNLCHKIELCLASINASRHSDTKTPRALAEQYVHALTKANSYIELPDAEGPPFLSPAEQEEAEQAGIPGETHLAARMNSHFRQRLLPCFPAGYVLVNSEHSRWLERVPSDKSSATKPDSFIAPRALVAFRAPHQHAAPGQDHGLLAVSSTKSSVGLILDARRRLDTRELGEFLSYILVMVQEGDALNPIPFSKGIVFDATSFYLVTGMRGAITRIQKGRWSQAGSLNAIQAFAAMQADAWTLALDKACQLLEVSVVECSTAEVVALAAAPKDTAAAAEEAQEPGGVAAEEAAAEDAVAKAAMATATRSQRAAAGCQALLGVGAFGRVFRVSRGKEKYALKIALPVTAFQFETNFQNMLAVQRICPHQVCGVVDGTLHTFEVHDSRPVQVGCYLMPVAGVPYQPGDRVGKAEALQILITLSELHIHGIVHGDARLLNVIKCGTDYRWIDFIKSPIPSKAAMQHDVETMLGSLGRAVDDAKRECIVDYVELCHRPQKPSRETRKRLMQCMY